MGPLALLNRAPELTSQAHPRAGGRTSSTSSTSTTTATSGSRSRTVSPSRRALARPPVISGRRLTYQSLRRPPPSHSLPGAHQRPVGRGLQQLGRRLPGGRPRCDHAPGAPARAPPPAGLARPRPCPLPPVPRAPVDRAAGGRGGAQGHVPRPGRSQLCRLVARFVRHSSVRRRDALEALTAGAPFSRHPQREQYPARLRADDPRGESRAAPDDAPQRSADSLLLRAPPQAVRRPFRRQLRFRPRCSADLPFTAAAPPEPLLLPREPVLDRASACALSPRPAPGRWADLGLSLPCRPRPRRARQSSTPVRSPLAFPGRLSPKQHLLTSCASTLPSPQSARPSSSASSAPPARAPSSRCAATVPRLSAASARRPDAAARTSAADDHRHPRNAGLPWRPVGPGRPQVHHGGPVHLDQPRGQVDHGASAPPPPPASCRPFTLTPPRPPPPLQEAIEREGVDPSQYIR